MYLLAKDYLASRIGIQTEGETDDSSGYEFVDAIVRWFESVFEKLGTSSRVVVQGRYSWYLKGSWFAEVLPKLGETCSYSNIVPTTTLMTPERPVVSRGVFKFGRVLPNTHNDIAHR